MIEKKGLTQRIRLWLQASPSRIKALNMANELLTIVGYLVYPLLLVILVVQQDLRALLLVTVVPGVSFVAVSVFRSIYNAPRPYENGGPAPLVPKTTKGHSFPSRHTFSLFTIAFAWCVLSLPVGIVLAILAALLGLTRVIAGVHYPRDVVAAFLIALACSAFYLLY